MHHLFLAVHHMDKDRVVGAIGQAIPKVARVLPDQAAVRPGRPHACATSASSAAAIHGDLPQAVARAGAARFADGKLRVLVATDVAARGIDIDDIGAVIHYEPAQGRQGLPAPLRPHGPRRARRLGGHARRVQPAHADAHPAARAAAAARAADRGVQQQPELRDLAVVRRRRHDRLLTHPSVWAPVYGTDTAVTPDARMVRS